jgi:hypothetical protein
MQRLVMSNRDTRLHFDKDGQVFLEFELVAPFPIHLSTEAKKRAKRMVRRPTARERQVLGDALRRALLERVYATVVDANGAARQGAVLAFAARADTAALALLARHWHSETDLLDWERARSVRLPHIDRLTPAEVVEVRERAALALKPFRARIGRGLAARSGVDPEVAARALAAELNEEAAQLEVNLRAIQETSGTLPWLAAATGLGLLIYGVAQREPAVMAASTPFISTLSNIHTAGRTARQEEIRLRNSPAYVLLTAARVLEERQSSGEQARSLARRPTRRRT